MFRLPLKGFGAVQQQTFHVSDYVLLEGFVAVLRGAPLHACRLVARAVSEPCSLAHQVLAQWTHDLRGVQLKLNV